MNLSVVSIFIILLISSCDRGFQREAYNLPEEPTLELVELFRVSEPTDGVFFRWIRGIHILSDGKLIVQDVAAQQLFVFNQDGGFETAIGRKGRGPGEFEETYYVYVGSDDSLHVFEIGQSRHQVLARTNTGDWKHVRERVFKVRQERGFGMPIPDSHVMESSDGRRFGIFRINPGFEDTSDGVYRYVSTLDENLEQSGESSRVRFVSDMAIGRKGENHMMLENHRFQGAFYNYMPDTDEVVYVKNTSNEIRSIDSEGKETVIGRLPYNRVPINQERVEGSIDDFREHAPFMEGIVREKILDHEPFYWNVMLKENRLWVHLEREDKDKPDWLITTLNGEVLDSFHIPNYIWAMNMVGNRFYGAIPGDNGEVYFVGYELRRK
jgi:hypothetical protein